LFSIAVVCSSYEGLSQTYTDLHDFNCSTDGCNPQFPAVLAQGRDGNLYGTMSRGGANSFGTFFGVTPSGTLTALYSFDGNLGDGNTPLSGVTLGWTDGKFYG